MKNVSVTNEQLMEEFKKQTHILMETLQKQIELLESIFNKIQKFDDDGLMPK